MLWRIKDDGEENGTQHQRPLHKRNNKGAHGMVSEEGTKCNMLTTTVLTITTNKT